MSFPGSALAGRIVVVTAGGTREPIDPVRFVGNRSSGRMGNALATAAADRGAVTTLVTTAPAPENSSIDVVFVDSAAEMDRAVRAALADSAVLIMAAAVADYRPAQVASRKLKKQASLNLHLVPTVDILRSLATDPRREGLFVVGFAAETDDLEASAARKLAEKRLDLIVLNDVSRSDIAMGSDDNEVTVLDERGVVARISRRAKPLVAAAVLDIVEERLGGRPQER
jgi:phosphopantothenoylcysteine decarboxylase/phosphopantothenate--cysteine ligase